MAREMGDPAVADRFAKYLITDHAKFTANVACGKLKQAYQLAVKQVPVAQALTDVALVRQEANSRLAVSKDDAGLTEVVKLCGRYISANQKSNP